jgi:DNA polymerase-3 subunit alpha
MSIERALSENAELRSIYEADDQVQRLVDTAKQVEGVARHASTHAAGVVIGSEPLVNFLPLQRPARGDDTSIPTTQFAMEAVADIGLLKMDFLGLANLTILGRAVEIIRETQAWASTSRPWPTATPRRTRSFPAARPSGSSNWRARGCDGTSRS